MEVEGEAAGGRAVVAHVGCCVILCLCFVCCGASGHSAILYQRYLLCRKLDINSGKMADLCTLIDNDAPNKIQNLKRLQNHNHS
jgi:hypothetical protein